MPTGTPVRVAAHLVLCTLLLAAGSGACSYAFVDGPPESHRQMIHFTCTSSNTLPMIDTVVGGIYAIGAIGAGASAASQSQRDAKIALAVGEAAAAALFGSSAYSGYGKTSKCREAVSELQTRAARMQLQNSMGLGGGQLGSAPFRLPPPRDPWLSPPTETFGTPPTSDPEPTAPLYSPDDRDVPAKKR